MKRTKLIEARMRKNWTLELAAERFGCSPNTINRWELGTVNPSVFYRKKLCEVYGTSMEELELDNPTQSSEQSDEIRSLIKQDIITYLADLSLSSYDSIQEIYAILFQAIKEFSIMEPDAIEKMREALRHLAILPQVLKKIPRPVLSVIHQFAAGVTACGLLSNGNRSDMSFASTTVSAYIPDLEQIMQSATQYQRQTAMVLSQALQIKQRLAYHLEDLNAVLRYASSAVDYARYSKNKTVLTMALRELASVYEWPLRNMKPEQRRKFALMTNEEAARIMEQKGSGVPHKVKSWTYSGLAKFQALNGLEENMKISVSRASEYFETASDEENVPGLNLDKPNLIRQRAIAYAYLGQQDVALNLFSELIDFDNHMSAKLTMQPRTHLGIISEATFASLKLPPAKKDKTLSINLWMAKIDKALTLQSETYFNEAFLAYQIMEGIWSDDAVVRDLRDILIHW